MSTMATISALPDINWSTTVEWGSIPPESDRGVSTVYTSFSPSGVMHVWSWDLEQWVELVLRSPADDAREAELLAENERLRAALEFEKREVAHWKANHANRVEAARVLIERPDTPLERVDAYRRYLRALQVAQDIVEQGKNRPLPGMEVIQQLMDDRVAQDRAMLDEVIKFVREYMSGKIEWSHEKIHTLQTIISAYDARN